MARDVPESGDRPADEIEVTPAMIEAGVDVYRLADRLLDDDKSVVNAIYEAMSSAKG